MELLLWRWSTTAQIASSLGRNLAACGTQAVCTAFAVVPLYPPFTRFEPRFTQVDLRITKILTLGSRTRLHLNADLYNALNASSVLVVNSTYGPSCLQPGNTVTGSTAAYMPGRLLHIGTELTF